MRRRWILVFAVALFLPADGSAQEQPSLRQHHVTVEAGGVWSGSYNIGSATADLRGNTTGATPPAFHLFTAESRISPVIAPRLRVGLAITSRIGIEGGASFASPHVGVRISGDAEAPAQELPGEQLQEYLIDGALTWQLPVRMGARTALFALAGGGYLRQLHEDRTLSETGQIYYTGAGARYWIRGGRGASMALGVRGDIRVNVRRKGIDFEDKMRAYPTFSLTLFVGL